jgi:hypothetical protein
VQIFAGLATISLTDTAMDDALNHHLATSYRDDFIRIEVASQASLNETRQRQVWFVAIAGFLLVSGGPVIWPMLLGQGLGYGSFLFLATPLAGAILVAIGTHVYADRTELAHRKYTQAVITSTKMAQAPGQSAQVDAIWAELMTDSGKLQALKQDSERKGACLVYLQWMALGGLAFGVVWALGAPALVRAHLSHRGAATTTPRAVPVAAPDDPGWLIKAFDAKGVLIVVHGHTEYTARCDGESFYNETGAKSIRREATCLMPFDLVGRVVQPLDGKQRDADGRVVTFGSTVGILFLRTWKDTTSPWAQDEFQVQSVTVK